MTKTDLQWLEDFLRNETTEYLEKVVVTQQERQDILEWVRSGESVHTNPWCMADDNGRPMDYITAQRHLNDLAEQYADAPAPF